MKKTQFPNLPDHLAQVAMIDARTAAAVGGMSVSWWLAQVQSGHAPEPVIRSTRCTRWLSASVESYWRSRAENGPRDVERAGRLAAQSRKASDASVARAAARAKLANQAATQRSVVALAKVGA